jgi:hypothetical protein
MFCSLLALCTAACGGRSSLDDYADGIPDIVPSPIVDVGDAAVRDAAADEDAGGRDAGRDAGPTQLEGNVGEACEDDRDCSGELGCAEEIDLFLFTTELPGGYCSGACQSDDDCPRGSGCDFVLGACLQECTRNTQCRANEGYTCALFTPLSQRTFCVPAAE